MKNFFLCKSFEGVNSCGSTVLAGQHNLSDAEYSHVAEQHLSELWRQYGNLTEIWVDSGLPAWAEKLMHRYQPGAVGTPWNPTLCKLPRYRWHLGCILLKTPAYRCQQGAAPRVAIQPRRW